MLCWMMPLMDTQRIHTVLLNFISMWHNSTHNNFRCKSWQLYVMLATLEHDTGVGSVSIHPPICPSHTRIESKLITIGSWRFHYWVARPRDSGSFCRAQLYHGATQVKAAPSVHVSVCLSVCHKLIYHVKTNPHRISWFHHQVVQHARNFKGTPLFDIEYLI